MVIMGIDPGLINSGYGLIQTENFNMTYITSGHISTSGDLFAKINTIYKEIYLIAKKYQPQIVSIERIFVREDKPNPDSIIKLAQARGAIISAITNLNIPIYEYSANQIKKTVMGSGHADKKQIAYMVAQHLKVTGTFQKDAADALAISICHHFNNF